MNHLTCGYMNIVHISENDIISCITCTEIIDDNTEDVLQCIPCLQLLI